MTAHPLEHQLTEALLHHFPGKSITLHQSAPEQLYTILIIGGFSISIVVDLAHAAICKLCDAHEMRGKLREVMNVKAKLAFRPLQASDRVVLHNSLFHGQGPPSF